MASQNDVVNKLVDAGMGVEDAIQESRRMIEEAKQQPGITLTYQIRANGKSVAILYHPRPCESCKAKGHCNDPAYQCK